MFNLCRYIIFKSFGSIGISFSNVLIEKYNFRIILDYLLHIYMILKINLTHSEQLLYLNSIIDPYDNTLLSLKG